MLKAFLVAMAATLLAGCNTDNGPDFNERNYAFKKCIEHEPETANWVRVACTFAIYGFLRD